MDLRWPWVLLAVAVGVALLLVWWSRRPARGASSDVIHVAHLDRLRALPRYRRLRRRQRLAVVWLVLGSLVAVAGTALLAARAQEVRVDRDSRERDVMLCLDASYSMRRDNARVVEQVRRVVEGLSGARVGLTLFSGAAVTVVPLTDDLDFVSDELARAQESFETGEFLYAAGIDLDRAPRASLLGDGIASCAERFDRLDQDRARSIIVTSDNDPFGRPVYSVAEGAQEAAGVDVVVHGLASARTRAGAADEFEDAVTAAGGSFATLDEDGTEAELVDQIEAQDARRTQVPPREVVTDDPELGTVVTASGVGLLALGWAAQGWSARRRR